jgi:hypothetical protein
VTTLEVQGPSSAYNYKRVIGMAIAAQCATGIALAQCPAPNIDHDSHANTQTIVVTGAAALQLALRDANTGAATQIIITPGTYELDAPLIITRRGLTLRGESGDRNSVILRGQGPSRGINHIVLVQASDFVLADLTVGWVRHHAVQVQGELDADRPRFSNVRFADTGQQLLKVSGSTDEDHSSDQGIVENSLFEYTSGVAPSYYTAGIDVHRGQAWIVRDNLFRGIRSPDDRVAEHAIHFWSGAGHTVVERNVLLNVDRGIGFGLGDRGHRGGIIRNNMIVAVRDVGIGLETASGVLVAHNTVLSKAYPNAIEARFAGTNGTIIQNNLTNAGITLRDGGQARILGNVTDAKNAWFADVATADLRLKLGIGGVVDAGLALPQVELDIDCEPRSASVVPDIGADETTITADGRVVAGGNPSSEILSSLWRQVSYLSDSALKRIAASPTLMALAFAGVLMIATLIFLALRILRIREPEQPRRRRRSQKSEAASPSQHPAILEVKDRSP